MTIGACVEMGRSTDAPQLCFDDASWGPAKTDNSGFLEDDSRSSELSTPEGTITGSSASPSMTSSCGDKDKAAYGEDQTLQTLPSSKTVNREFNPNKFLEALDSSTLASKSLMETVVSASNLIKQKRDLQAVEEGRLDPITRLDIASGCNTAIKMLRMGTERYLSREAGCELRGERDWAGKEESALKDLLRSMNVTGDDVKRMLDE